MPPPAPSITDEAVLAWLRQLPTGQFHVDVAEPFTPQIAPEGAWVFEWEGRVFTIWPTSSKSVAARPARPLSLLRAIIHQIESADYRHPESGSPLVNNVHFIAAKEALNA